MSDYSSVAPPQNNSQTAAFAAAVQRARLIAAKIDGGGNKRPLEDGQEPSAKKLAGLEGGYQSPPGGMSAGAQGGGGPRPTAPAPLLPDQTVNEHMRVPDKMVGLIIGRGGEQISRLQAESGCKIQMAPDGGGQAERMCMLTGSREAVARAKEMVSLIVNQRGRDGGPPDNGPPQQQRMGGPPGGGLNQNFDVLTCYVPPPAPPARPSTAGFTIHSTDSAPAAGVTEEIMVPGPKVGLIIGKGGETIKQLQEKSGAKMVVIQDGPNPEYEKPLRITGDSQKVEYAKQLVYELIAEKEMQYSGGRGKPPGGSPAPWGGPQGDDFDQQQVPDGHEVLVPRAAVGVVIGKGGDMIKKIQADTGARVQFHQGRDEGPGDRRCFLQGKPHQVEQAKGMIGDLIDSVNRRDQDGAGRGSGGRPQRNGGDGNAGGPAYGSWGGPQEHKLEVSFSVSNVKCGIIIGRGGEVIKQINAQSGAHCELDRRTQNNRGNRTFYIRGDPENVEAAKRIISEKVGMPINFNVENGNGGGGGGNSGGGGGGGGGNGGNGGGGNNQGGNGGDYGGYGGQGGGAQGGPGGQAWGYNPHWHPSQQQEPQQQHQNVPVNPATGQPDYSQQWVDYYRSLGLVREAEAIEQQSKLAKGGVTGNPTPQPAPQHPQAGGGGVSTNGGGAGGGAGAAGGAAGGAADYSAQWAEYYRSMGKLKEAEAIEAQMKQKSAGPGVAAGGAPSGGAAYSAGGAPYQPAPYQHHQHFPGYAPYTPAYPAHPAPPDQPQ